MACAGVKPRMNPKFTTGMPIAAHASMARWEYARFSSAFSWSMTERREVENAGICRPAARTVRANSCWRCGDRSAMRIQVSVGSMQV